MIRALRPFLALLLALAGGSVCAQQDKPALPHVLIIGDAIYRQHARGVLTELKEQANIQFANWPKAVLPNSTNAIEHIDLLLGLKDAAGNDVPEDKRPTWDLIHFNVGLGDLIYCVPHLQSHRVLPYTAGGVIRTDTRQYEQNLETLVRLLRQKAPTAKIVWASTTPIRHSRENVFKLGTEIEYNQIAARVMSKHGVPINDLYTYAKSLIDMDKPASHGVDPFFFDRKPLHPPIVEVVRATIGIE
mgnify:CR=1 FL=1